MATCDRHSFQSVISCSIYFDIGSKVKFWTPPPIFIWSPLFDIPPFKDFLIPPEKNKALKLVKKGCCTSTDIVLKSALNKYSNEWTKETVKCSY